MRHLIFALAIAFFAFVPAAAQTDADREGITRAALNYAEGWYEGNAEKMQAALHPDLAKRIVRTNEQGRSRLDQMSALTLVNAAGSGAGKQTPKERQQKDVKILDVYRGIASVRLDMDGWIDYLQVAKWEGKWVIVNVLWETKPRN